MATEAVDKSVQLILFEAIETALADLITDRDIYSVEIFNSQTDFESTERPRDYPYVAVNISTEWVKNLATNGQGYVKEISQTQQQGNTLVTIYTIFSNLNNETVAFKEAEPIRHCVHRAINLLEDSSYFTKLQRISSDLDSSHDRVFSFVTQYSTMVLEAALKDSTKETATDVTPVLTPDFVIDNETVRTAYEIP